MVLLLYIQNQDRKKNDQKKIKFPEKQKNSESYYNPKQTPKNPSTTTKKFCHTQFFFTSNEQEKEKITKKQNKQEKKK